MATEQKKSKPGQSQADIAKLKDKYVDYYAQVPVQKYAAMAVGRDEDTIILWRTKDKAFSDRVEEARSEFVRKRVLESKAEFTLERLEREIFAPPKQQVEHSGDTPIKALLEDWGILKDIENDRQAPKPVQSPPAQDA